MSLARVELSFTFSNVNSSLEFEIQVFFSYRVGIIEWVGNSIPLKELIASAYSDKERDFLKQGRYDFNSSNLWIVFKHLIYFLIVLNIVW